MIDQDAELQRFKWILASGLMFLITGCLAYSELRYAIWGETAQAKVHDVRDTISTSRRAGSMVSLHYTFTESDGTQRTDHESVPADSPLVGAQTILVRYLPGVDQSSRIEGSVRFNALLFFLGSLLWLAYSIYSMAREAHTPISRGPRRRSR